MKRPTANSPCCIEAKIRTELAEGKYFDRLPGENKTVKEMMDKFMEEHAPKVSIKMQISYRTSLNNLMPFFGNMELTGVKPKEISKYKQTRLKEGKKPATVNRELACLSKAFSLTVKEWEWIRENPVSKIPREKENNERYRWLTPEEEANLMFHSPGWLEEIIIFALNTGMRKDEILSLKWQDLNLFRKVVIVTDTKNREPRTIPLNDNAMEMLIRKSQVRRLGVDYVFPSSVGTKRTPRNLSRAFCNAIEKAGIKDFRFHDLRHTFATRLAQAGIDLYAIAKLLGQKTLAVTARYAHHCPESLRNNPVSVLDSGYNLATMRERKGSNKPQLIDS